ncbi:MAG: hypothetical protein HIU91_14200 [Acidobacteria bacterium]|nr:hypothetical protein [Acidobacteriota bacterium]
MLPKNLQADQFSGYPPKARGLAVLHIATFRQLPLVFLPGLLRELIEYDFKFPAERTAIDGELATLSARSPVEIAELFRGFSILKLSESFEHFDWVNQPARFVEQESAYLWSTHQLDAFRSAATQYGNRVQASLPNEPPTVRRLGIAVIGQGSSSQEPLFRKLRPHGIYFNQVKPDDGLGLLLAAVEARAKTYPSAYAHWYVDGGEPALQSSSLTTVSYAALQPVRSKLLGYMQQQIASIGMGPEELRTNMATLLPKDLGMSGDGDQTLNRFQVSLFTEGSGTQIFSTTFAQWTTREVLRRAQPLTLMVRYAPRQRQRPMSELLSNSDAAIALDLPGSLVDADMAAYYHWINQERLPGAGESSFLVWFEGHDQALVIAPTLPRDTQSDSVMDLADLVRLIAD